MRILNQMLNSSFRIHKVKEPISATTMTASMQSQSTMTVKMQRQMGKTYKLRLVKWLLTTTKGEGEQAR